MMERGWLGEKRGQGFYKRVGKPTRRSTRSICKTLEYHPAQQAEIPVRRGREAASRICRSACGRWSPPTIAPASSSGSCSATMSSIRAQHGSGDLGPHRRDRPRHALGLRAFKLGPFELWDALGVRRDGRRGSEAEGATAAGQRASGCSRRARTSFYQPADRDGQPGTSYFDLNATGCMRRSKPRPGVLVLGDLKRARGVVEDERRRVADRSRRRRAVPGVPQQDELAGRRRGADDPRRHRRDRAQLRGAWSSPTRAKISASART